MITLKHEVSVYVCIPEQVDEVITWMVDEFGGATVTRSSGYWKDSEGKLHADYTTVVTSHTKTPTTAQDVTPLVQWLFARSSEKAITVKTDTEGLCIFDRVDTATRTA